MVCGIHRRHGWGEEGRSVGSIGDMDRGKGEVYEIHRRHG